MYIPSYFENKNYPEIVDFLQHNSFGVLVTYHNQLLEATHIPFRIKNNTNNELVVSGHIAAKNNQVEAIKNGVKALCIFQGPHAYVSSSWYTHINVPTWNYVAVHVEGVLNLLSLQDTKDMLSDMVEKYEHGRENRFHMSSMSSEMYDAYLKEIVGFEIKVESISAKNKLSQNRSEADYKNIVNRLEKEKDIHAHEVAKLMQK